MAQEKSALQNIDETIKAVETISNVLKSAKEQLDKLEKEKASMEQEKMKVEQEKTKLENDKKNLEAETQKLEGEKQDRDKKIGSLSQEQMRLLDEYDKLKVKLGEFAKVAANQKEAEFNFERIQALLSIYSVLVSDIWQGQPHYRILMTLHGDKEEMTREELKNTTGIGGAYVLRAVQELAKANIVDYDEDTAVVKLKRRLFEKEALEEKGKEKKSRK